MRRAGGPPRVTTVHDLHYATAPDAHFGLRSLGMRVLVPAAVRGLEAGDHRLPVDEGRRGATDRHGRPRAIDVVPPRGGDAAGRARDVQGPRCASASTLSDRPILLSMAAKRPHKNVEGLIDALAGIPAERRPLLVVPGVPHRARAGAPPSALEQRGVRAQLRFPGWLAATDVEGLWRCWHGARLPVLRRGLRPAGARGDDARRAERVLGPERRCRRSRATPRCCSSPRIPLRSGTAIERLLDDDVLRKRLRDAGLARAATFSWERTARGTADSYERALAGA